MQHMHGARPEAVDAFTRAVCFEGASVEAPSSALALGGGDGCQGGASIGLPAKCVAACGTCGYAQCGL